jgi:S1-C subfamily serine protease
MLRLGDAPVATVDDLQRLLTDELIGRAIEVVVLRDGAQHTIPVTPGETP